MEIDVVPRNSLSEDDRQRLRRLTDAVYPPGDGIDDDPARRVTWASTDWSVILRSEDGREAIAHAGLLVRDGLLDGEPVRLGGVGGVKTHPDLQGQGLGKRVMMLAADYLRDNLRVDIGLLVCPPHVVPFYERLGWRQFTGTLWVEQPEGPTVFTANRVMVLPVLTGVPEHGTLDLLGLPW